MKKIVVIIFIIVLFIIGCEVIKIDSKSKNEEVSQGVDVFILGDSAEKIFNKVEKGSLDLNYIEEILNKEDNEISRLEAEGTIIYRCGEEEIEVIKGIEEKVRRLEYRVEGGLKRIGIDLGLDSPIISVYKQYENKEEKISDLEKLGYKGLQEDYFKIFNSLNDKLGISEIEEITDYKYIDDEKSEINGIVNYSRTEENEGLLIKEIDGEVVSVVYSSIPSEDILDVRVYEVLKKDSGEKINEIKIYRALDNVNEILEILWK